MRTDHPLWDFSLEHYRQPGVEALCLQAQDQFGVDVNVLLYAAWLARNGRALDAAHLDQVMARTAGWRRQAVYPLRALRRSLRTLAGAGSLRESLQKLELAAEHTVQDLLWEAYLENAPPAQERVSLREHLSAVFLHAGAAHRDAKCLVNLLADALGD